MGEVLDAIVIGGGIVGIAIARALALAGRAPIVIEREAALGTHQSSRNSEVIHAGLYYPPGSLKARSCLAGRRRLYEYCAARGVPHRRCGKLVVATAPPDLRVLERLRLNAAACRVDDLQLLDTAAVRRLEPELSCHAALLSPSSGIVDSHALLRALLSDADARGTTAALACTVTAVSPQRDGTLRVRTTDDEVVARRVVNAAGLGAQAIAATVRAADPPHAPIEVPPRYLAKGTYFTVTGRPFSRLVYPVPDSASLGIHVTVDMAGAVRFGPDQEWIDEVDYGFDPSRAAAFEASIRRYWPALPDGALQPGTVGVRAKVQAPGTPMADFVVHGPEHHGIAGLVNLFGIESPGLTACLSLADHVLQRLNLTPR